MTVAHLWRIFVQSQGNGYPRIYSKVRFRLRTTYKLINKMRDRPKVTVQSMLLFQKMCEMRRKRGYPSWVK